MAEISTIARPYAEALFKATQDSSDAGLADTLESVLKSLGVIASSPAVLDLVGNPYASKDQIFDLISRLFPDGMPAEAENFLKLVIENGRLDAMQEIASQFTLLKNEAKGEAEVVIESPFPLDDAQLAELTAALAKKFAGLKLIPKVVIEKSLIGGVRVSVGDQVLDGTVKARLAGMQDALTR